MYGLKLKFASGQKLKLALAVSSLFAQLVLGSAPSAAQEGEMNFGIPNSSPGVFWPRGFGIEALSPDRLYPNGPQFGLSNTSGGFGMTGSGAFSGVGLEQRRVSPLARQEFANPNAFNSVSEGFSREAQTSSAVFGAALAGSFRQQMRSSSGDSVGRTGPLVSPFTLPNVDAILRDSVPSTDSILDGRSSSR